MHRLLRDVHFMAIRLSHAHGEEFWTAVVALVFAVIFLVVGLTRIVEFKGIGLSLTKQRIFTVAHVIGCLLFSMALALLAIDVTKTRIDVMGVLVGSALLILFPVHIYLGLLRRIHLRNRQP